MPENTENIKVYVGREDIGCSKEPNKDLTFAAKESHYTAGFGTSLYTHVVDSKEFGIDCGDIVIRQSWGHFYPEGRLVERIKAISRDADALVVEEVSPSEERIINEKLRGLAAAYRIFTIARYH